MQIEAADLRGRHINVVGAGEIGSVGRAQEAEAVGQHLQRAAAEDGFPFFRLILEQSENEFLLAQSVGAVDLVFDGHIDEFADVEIFKVG